MIILHLAAIKNSSFGGVSVVVPQYVNSESVFCDVALININNIKINGVKSQFDYDKSFNINLLPSPFNKPDIVIFNEVYRYDYLKIARNLKKNKIPYIIIPHGELNEEAQKIKPFKKKLANFLLFNKFIYNAEAVQCLSAKEFDSTYFGKKKFVGTNGVSKQKETVQSFNSDKIVFSYVGRLDTHHKGLDLLMEAIREKRDFLKAHNCEFHIYGPGYFGRFEEVSKCVQQNGVSDLVTIHKEVVDDDKKDVLMNSDIFIQTSRLEGMPLGILEALSYGLPCFVTYGTTLGEVIFENDCGWAAETNYRSIANTLEICVKENDTLKSKCKNAINLVNRVFLWNKVSRDTIEKYRAVLLEIARRQ